MIEKNSHAKTNKTPHVMSLINNASNKHNPIIDKDFKEEIIGVRETALDSLKTMQKELEYQKSQIYSENIQPVNPINAKIVNVTQELVYDMLPLVLERFQCCKCDNCKAELIVQVLKDVESEYVSCIDEYSKYRINELKIKNYKMVLGAIIRSAVYIKNHPIH